METYLRRNLLKSGFLNRDGKESDRWFINKELKNTHYLFVWPKSKNKLEKHELDKLKEDDLTSVEIILVNKNDLIKEIQCRFLSKMIEKCRNREEVYPAQWKLKVDGLYLKMTDDLVEKPINFVGKKEIYEKLAKAHWIVENREPNRLK